MKQDSAVFLFACFSSFFANEQIERATDLTTLLAVAVFSVDGWGLHMYDHCHL